MITAKSRAQTYLTEITNGPVEIFADVAAEKGGSGKAFRPHQLLCASLASCLNITVRMVLERKAIAYDEVVVHVDLDQTVTEKTRFIYDVDIVGVSAQDKELVLRIVSTCPVKETLARPMEFYRKDDEGDQRE
ncbi:MAG: OsmC family protein [Selenomonadaceae bacterium]